MAGLWGRFPKKACGRHRLCRASTARRDSDLKFWKFSSVIDAVTWHITVLTMAIVAAPLSMALEIHEQPPLRYSETASNDPMALLARDWEHGRNLIRAERPLEFLRELLVKLDVPEATQVLVFSKTSHQNGLITPQTPRALYFSDETYVGYVQGGAIEVIACDDLLGPVFYLIDTGLDGGAARVRRTASCLSCHATARTENVPGMLVRAVVPDRDGRPILQVGSHLTTAASPLPERWGGWYVTGTHEGVRHMGNVTATPDDPVLDTGEGANWKSLTGKIDTSRYLRPTSDIVALMVLEHQCRMHNLITKAGIEYRRALWLSKATRPDLDENDETTVSHRVAVSVADEILREMLFVDEAEPGPMGVEGGLEFQEAFKRNARVSRGGRSLKDFRLYKRIFQHRCSYMIHTKAYASLPAKVRGLIHAGLRDILLDQGGGEDFADIGRSERRRIAEILDDTHPQWREGGKR